MLSSSRYWEHNCEPHLQEFTFSWEETQNKHINEYIIDEGGAKHYFYQGNGIQLDPSVDYGRPLKEI